MVFNSYYDLIPNLQIEQISILQCIIQSVLYIQFTFIAAKFYNAILLVGSPVENKFFFKYFLIIP
jgi:hypothetical protein